MGIACRALTRARSSARRCGASVLAATAIFAVMVGAAQPTRAQVVLNPPGAVPPECAVTGASAVCRGDLSAGVDADGPPLTSLTVQNLTQALGNTGANAAIDFDSLDSPIIIIANTGQFGAVSSREGILADVLPSVFGNPAVGNITISSVGDFTTGATALSAGVAGDGVIDILSQGDISAAGGGVAGVVQGDGQVTIRSIGDVSAATPASFPGFLTFGLSADVNGTGPLRIESTGNVVATGTSARAILANIFTTGPVGSQTNPIEIISNGDVSAIAVPFMGFDSAIGISAATERGAVLVVSNGAVTATGIVGIGIRAQALISGNVTVNASGSVSGTDTGVEASAAAGNAATLNLSDLTVSGGTSGGVHFMSVAGATETVNTSGTVTLSGTNGTAVLSGAGDAVINNSGVLNLVSNGAVTLGTGTNAINNRAGAVFNAGATVNLGAGNLFSNSGVLSPFGAGAFGVTAITGDLLQTSSGAYLTDLNVAGLTADRVNVSGTAALSGNVRVVPVALAPGAGQVTILSAAGGVANNGLGLLASPVLNANLLFPNANDVVIVFDPDFTAPNTALNRNQTSVATNLEKAFVAGPGGLAPLTDALASEIDSDDAYRAALDQLLPEIYLNTETATLTGADAFLDGLVDGCAPASGAEIVREDARCYWMRVDGRLFDFSGTSEHVGFDETVWSLSAGAEFDLAEGWSLAVSGGYGAGDLETDAWASSRSDRYELGGALAIEQGRYRFSGALAGGLYAFETDRWVSFGAYTERPRSEHDVFYGSGRLRAEAAFAHGDWEITPALDLTATHLARGGVTETGGGGANLVVESGDALALSATPSVAFSRDMTVSSGSVLRPYARLGVAVSSQDEHALSAAFAAAPAGVGAFEIQSAVDQVAADVALGVVLLGGEGAAAENAMVTLGYEGRLGEDAQAHGGFLKGTLRF